MDRKISRPAQARAAQESETMTLDQATQIREKQLSGHWTEPTRLAEAIAVIRQRIEPVSRSQYRKATRPSQRVVKVETE